MYGCGEQEIRAPADRLIRFSYDQFCGDFSLLTLGQILHQTDHNLIYPLLMSKSSVLTK